MKKIFLITLIAALSFGTSLAQKTKVAQQAKTNKVTKTTPSPKNKITVGAKEYSFDGSLFNSITYNFSSSKAKYDSYYFKNNAKKQLEIVTVEWEWEADVPTVKLVSKYVIAFAKINKKDSYNIEMEDETLDTKKYWRLTLLAIGANNNAITKTTKTRWDDEPDTNEKVSFITINITDKIQAASWLKELTK